MLLITTWNTPFPPVPASPDGYAPVGLAPFAPLPPPPPPFKVCELPPDVPKTTYVEVVDGAILVIPLTTFKLLGTLLLLVELTPPHAPPPHPPVIASLLPPAPPPP